MRIDAPIITGSFSLNGDTFNDLGAYTTTGSNTFIGDQSIVGAVSASALTGSISYTNLTGVPTLVSGSDQVVSILSSLNSYTQSNDTTNTTQNSRLTSLEEKTGSLASTGSNTFYGTQTISGTVYIANDLIVQGSSSLQNITGSSVNIGTNKVILNTANPAVRYAGISVIDSGSTGLTGSILWDSTNNNWLYQNPSGAAYTSAKFISGPQSQTLGSEPGLVTNFIQKAVADDHISSSAIYDDGSTVSIKSNTEISGSLKVNASILYFSGSVGIGITNPTNQLTLFATEPRIQLTSIASYNSGSWIGRDSSGLYFIERENASIRFQTSGNNVMYITGSNVGISSSSPVRKLDIVSTGEQLRLAYDTSGTVYTDFRNDSAGGLLINTSGNYIINYIGGSEKMRITNSGSVGIGTSPDNTYQGLTLYGSNPSIRLKGSGASSWNWIEFVTSTGTNNFSLGVNQTTPFFAIKAGAGMDTPDFVLSSAGKVGIGTASPSDKLHVYTGANGNAQRWEGSGYTTFLGMDATGAYLYQNSASRNFSIGSNSSRSQILLDSSGNVGINTTSPQALFDVYADNPIIRLSPSSGTYAFFQKLNTGNGNYLRVYDGTAYGMVWSGGKVGIGTDSLSAKLEVKASGDGDLIIGRYSGGSAKLFYVYQSSADGYLELRTGADATVTKLSGYTGTQSYMNTKLTVGGTSSYNAATLNVEGIIRANRSMYAWYQGGSNSWDGYQYLHLKTTLWGGGSPGNSAPTMSLFSARLYSYSGNYIREGNMGFHNWSGTIYSLTTTGTVWSGAYVSSDGYVVLVVALGGGSYMGVTVDWHQAFGYPFQDRYVSATSYSNSSSGVY